MSPNGIRFPFNSVYGFIILFKEGFAGCLGCGSEHHVLTSCLDHHTTGLSELFFQDLLCHVHHSQLTSRNANTSFKVH